jgi:hypothetical protein
MVAVLRQELDSMIRVIYLLSQSDIAFRDELIQASVEGKQWVAKGTKHRVTDKEMVELANELHGWTESVYRFGCAFIHLSSLTFVQSGPESLNQMQFCTAQSNAGSLSGGGTTCDNCFYGLADGKHATWDAGRLW